jgi:heme exporter protein D
MLIVWSSVATILCIVMAILLVLAIHTQRRLLKTVANERARIDRCVTSTGRYLERADRLDAALQRTESDLRDALASRDRWADKAVTLENELKQAQAALADEGVKNGELMSLVCKHEQRISELDNQVQVLGLAKVNTQKRADEFEKAATQLSADNRRHLEIIGERFEQLERIAAIASEHLPGHGED